MLRVPWLLIYNIVILLSRVEVKKKVKVGLLVLMPGPGPELPNEWKFPLS
jgi:hypothetical protein